jgi:UDP-N-acetylglucosamine 2-epimerase (non-hydrolysing)
MAQVQKIVVVVGARPNLVKAAPLLKEMSTWDRLAPTLVHTGQHYDANLSQVFFEELGLPEPNVYLGVGSGSHARQTARVMIGFEEILLQAQPDLVMVVGDVNSTLACAITAAKLNVPVAHVEAGLRSFDRTMPEEINRIVTDALSDLLFTTSAFADRNLQREGISDDKIFFVGNVMIDTLLAHLERAGRSDALCRYALNPGEYALLTLHRPSNVDDRGSLEQILAALEVVQSHVRVIFPVHPRTRLRLREFALEEKLDRMAGSIVTAPLSYLEFLQLMSHARLILTDSGGIQEETTVLGIPCLTLRDNTERPETVAQGTNTLVGQSYERIVSESLAILNGKSKCGQVPELWDGKAASRIVDVLLQWESDPRQSTMG